MSGAVKAEHPRLPVRRYRLGPENLGEPSGAVTPLQLHLEQPLLGVHKSEAEGEILIVLRNDPRHPIGIPFDPDLGLRAGQQNAPINLRQSGAQV